MEIICPFKIIFGIRTKTIYDLLKKQEEIGKSFYFKCGLILLEAVDWKEEWEITQSEVRKSVCRRLYSHDLWLTEGNKKPSEHVYHVNTILLSDGLW